MLAGLLVVATLLHFSLFSRMSAEVAGVFLQALVFSSALSLVPVAVLWFLDRRERENRWLLAGAFLWGGCIATALSLPVNSVFFQVVDRWVALNPVVTEILGPDATILIAAPLSAPIIEEITKAAGVALIFWLLRDEFDNMRDGFVYGALVGAGFNWFEAPLHIAQTYAHDGVAPYSLQLGVRFSLFGLGGHAMFTGLFGMFFGLVAQSQSIWLRLLGPVAGLVLAIAGHMLNNALPLFAALAAASEGLPIGREVEHDASINLGFLEAFLSGSLVQLTTFLPFLVILVLALWRSGSWERRVIREELASEVGRSVSPGEYQAIRADGILRTRRIDDLRPNHSAALVNAQHELAFRKRRVRNQGQDPDQDHLVAGWRRDIDRLRTTG